MLPRPAHELDEVAAEFMAHRPKLYAIAHRTLGSPWLADDAVQEAWIRLQRADLTSIRSREAWLTTVIARVCIDMIRQRTRRPEDPDGGATTDAGPPVSAAVGVDPPETVMRSDDLAAAMQIMLDELGPLERLALVLHDVFDMPYDDVAPIVERTPVAARQLASRARARLRDVDVPTSRGRQEAAIGAFLHAARQGNFGELLQLLDPEIELRSDEAAVHLADEGAEDGAPLLDHRVRGVDAVARVFAGRAELARLVSINGVPGAAYVTDATVRAAYLVTIDADRITRIDVLADPARLAALTTRLP